MATQNDKIKKTIGKEKEVEVKAKKKRLISDDETDIQQNVSKGRKITIKIQRGDKVVIGRHEKQKSIDFVLLDRKEIKQKGEEEQKQMEMGLAKKQLQQKAKKQLGQVLKPYNKNKEKVITLADDDEDYNGEIIEVEDEINDSENNNQIGHIEQEDEDEILKQNKKITQRISPFLCQALIATKDPRQSKLVQEIQNILQQQPEYKLNLILDLDETLVNTVWVNSENQKQLEEIYRYKMPMNKNILTISYTNNEGVQKEFISIMRPHLREFLTEVKNYFNVFVYSHGRKEYVYKLLDKIDPRRDLFNRNNVFKNEGQINLKTQKDIKNILLCNSHSNHEAALKSTIIIDDIYEVWLEETLKNVVPIKRFQPLNDFLQKQNYCTLFMNHNKQFIRFPKTHQQIFQDIDIQDSSNQFLKGLSRYLTSTALQFYNKKLIKKDQSVDVRDYLVYQNLVIMNQLDLNLSLLEQEDIYDVYKYIALTMGANITLKNFRYALLNKDSVPQCQKRMSIMKEQNPSLTFIDVQWLVDSYFLHFQLDIQNYLI